MTNDPQISIIILNDNIDLLDITLNSLENQSFKNFEVICLNDNVNYDNDNFKVVNDNLANTIPKCKGNFVLFLKSGDILLKSSLKYLLDIISSNNADFVFFNSKNYNDKNNDFEKYELKLKENGKIEKHKIFHHDSEDFRNYIFSDLNNINEKLYSKRFLLDNSDIIFESKDTFDFVFNLKASFLADKVISLGFVLVFHKVLNIHENFKQINKKIISSEQSSLEIVDMMEDIENFLLKNNLYEKYENEFKLFALKNLINNLEMSKFHENILFVPEQERDIVNNKFFDYSKYYNSNSSYIGLPEDYSNIIFNKTKLYLTKQSIIKREIRDLPDDKELDLIYEKYDSIIKSENFREYVHLSNLTTVNKLKRKNYELKNHQDYLNKNFEIYEKLINENQKLLDQSKILISFRKTNIKYLNFSNSKNISQKNKLSSQNLKLKKHFD